MDWSEKDLCIKCNKGGNLLVCSENGCPLTVHEECLGCPLRFDDESRFHCPYCAYKKDVAESRRAREYALARKKALLLFMDENIMGGEKHIKKFKRAEKNGCDLSKISKVNVTAITSNGGISKLNTDATLDQPIQLDEEHKISYAEEDSEAFSGSRGPDPSLKLDEDHSIRDEEEERKQEEEHEASVGSKGQDSSLKLDVEHCISIDEEKKIQDEEHETSEASAGSKDQDHEEQRICKEEEENNLEEQENSSASSGKDLSVKMHKHKICNNEEEEEILEGKCETLSASTGEDLSLAEQAKAKRGFKRTKQVDRDSEAVSVRRKKRKKQVDWDSEADSVRRKLRKQLDKNKQTSPSVNSPRRFSMRSSSAQKTRKGSNEVAGSSKRLKQSEQPSARIASDIFGSGKRKRLFWTEEEEKALKEGVEKYSKQSNPKFPWRKVLEDGHDKFDPTRTPGDLKVKWRNMSRK